MDSNLFKKGGFTLPGEAGYEDLTLKLAKKWGADVIRDSDGTQLSDKIITSDYDIYSTICLVRADNEWAKANRDKLQQCYIMSFPIAATSDVVQIDLLKGFSKEQLQVNEDDNPYEWWQVFDRTSGEEVPKAQWQYSKKSGIVIIKDARKWHRYTVNFLAYRIWEEISAYNHITNDWGDKEHLMPIEPMYEEAQEKILAYLERWLQEHPHTKVVRFTSMFYNFWWLWGDDPNRKFIVNDWGAYDFAVSSFAIREFEKVKGYRLTSEDFIHNGLYNNSYLPPSDKYRDWMNFIIDFVTDFGKKCIELVHKYHKKAYVFYNDHWIGIEPTLERFKEFKFDGIIDGIFNGFETRKVAGTKHVATKELRLHPYLFPTGVNGAGTFIEGGNPTLETKTYWMDIRRALLRESVDRIGFGGYLHLVEGHPDFVEYVEALATEFRMLRELHKDDRPYTSNFKVAILTAWGNMRAWGCRGHFNHGNYYNEVMESISGLPVEVEFISFKDVLEKGIDSHTKVIINAGSLDDAWSGGWNWQNPKVIEILSEWIWQGGGFIGIGEPSANKSGNQYFRLSHILGVDREYGLTIGFDKYKYAPLKTSHFILGDIKEDLDLGKYTDNVFALDCDTQVLADEDKSVQIATHTFGKGRSVYLAGHKYSSDNVRLLHRAIYWSAHSEEAFSHWLCSNIHTECAYYPNHNSLAVINNSFEKQKTVVKSPDGTFIEIELNPCESKILEL
ncbi:MAG: 1,3-beta-galactosyl-N-acetylhexosamine phosphorylase [Clostridia bacterium]|nr:1,3-beta-galactosyl-N-acetylhexosamine phosphorylase [Clostridia bacterium]